MNKDIIIEAVEHLKKGGVILYPTDTIWGIGCDATNIDAVEKVIALKNRPENKSLIALVHSVPFLERYVRNIPHVAYDVIDNADKPITIIYEKPYNIAENALAADGSMGIRVTADSYLSGNCA
jgi:L-threonylcarbamoyladenylate synthase